MTDTRARVLELCGEIDVTPWGPQERAMLDEALRLVRELDDEDLEYQVRIRQTASANMAGDTDTLLSAFAWCLARYDRDPQRFPAQVGGGRFDVLWHYKWMASALSRSPLFPTEQVEAVLDDMEAHYDRAGLGPSGVLMSRFETAWHQGRFADAEELRTRVLTTPRDDYSHCEACVPSQNAGFLAEVGREAEALAVTDEMLAAGVSCAEEPENAMARSLLPLLRAGRSDDAVASHLRAYRMSRDNPDHLPMIADHLVFCAVTGNTARGLGMLERHLGWLTHDGLDVDAQTQMMRATGVLLDAVTAAGYGDTPVRGADADDLVPFFGPHDGPWSARDLGVRAWTWVEETSARFDRRNGTDRYARLATAARALAAQRYEAPIQTQPLAPAAAADPEPSTGSQWLEKGREHAWLGEAAASVDALAHALAVGDLSDVERAEALGILPGMLLRADEGREAAAVMGDRVAALRVIGRTAEADLEQRLGLLMHTQEAEALPVLQASLMASEAAGADGAVLVRLRHALADHLETAGAAGQAAELAEQVREALADEPQRREYRDATSVLSRVTAATDPERSLQLTDELLALDLDRAERGFVLWHRANLLGGAGAYAIGGPVADESMQLLAAAGGRAQAAQSAVLAGQLYEDAGQPEESVQRFRFAIGQAELAEDMDVTTLRFQLGRALLKAGRPVESADVLADVLETETRRGVEPASRGATAFWLGNACYEGEFFAQALAAWEQAASLSREGADHGGTAWALRRRAQLLMGFEEYSDAESDAVGALGEARLADDLELVIHSLHLLGNLELQTRGEAALGRLREARDLAVAHQEERPELAWQVADITDSEARALATLGRTEEALAHGLHGADLYGAAGDADNAANAEAMVASLLAGADRHGEALPVLEGALGKVEHPMLRTRILLELAELYEALGRHAEAAQARANAESS